MKSGLLRLYRLCVGVRAGFRPARAGRFTGTITAATQARCQEPEYGDRHGDAPFLEATANETGTYRVTNLPTACSTTERGTARFKSAKAQGCRRCGRGEASDFALEWARQARP